MRNASALVLSIACLTVGCAPSQGLDLKKVQDFAKTTEDARASFTALASDLDASCERSRDLIMSAGFASPPRVVRVEVPNPIVTARPTPTATPNSTPMPTPSPAETPFFSEKKVPEKCIVFKTPDKYPVGAVSEDWNRANAVVLDFVQGLGAIANVDAAPKNVPKVTQAIVDAGVLKAAQATLINSTIASIVNFFGHQTERRDIAAFLAQVSPDFPEAANALIDTASGYEEIVDAECTFTQNFYIRAVRAAQNGAHRVIVASTDRKGKMRTRTVELTDVASDATHPSVLWGREYAIRKIRAEWRDSSEACERHKAAAEAYKVVVKKIADTEQSLYDSSHKPLIGKALFDALSRNADDLSDAASNLYTLVFPDKPPATKGK